MKNNQVISKKNIKVKTYDWVTFSNNVSGSIIALCELVHNGYAAGFGTTNMRVDVSIVEEFGEKYLYVKNWGKPANIERVLDYGASSHATALNQFGTGFKTAMSYFNPANDGWEFYTHDGDFCQRAKAPYSESMDIETLESWPFEDEVASCARVRIDDNSRIEGIDAGELGYRYSRAIRNGLKLHFNGKKVMPIEPMGAACSDAAHVDICGKDVKIEFAMYNLGEDTVNEKYYPMSLKSQGVYLFVNHCFSRYLGTKEVLRKGTGNAYLQEHPSMNGLVAIVDIQTPEDHSADVPFFSAKDAIRWGTDIGRAYRKAIDGLVGEHFRTVRANAAEIEKRKKLKAYTQAMFNGVAFFQEEVRLGKELRADAIIASEISSDGRVKLESTKKIIEYKIKDIKPSHIHQAISYWTQLHLTYGISPDILMVGNKVSADAKAHAQYEAGLRGIKIQFADWETIQFSA